MLSLPTERSSVLRMAVALSQGPWTKKGLPWCPKPRAVRTGPGPEMTSGSLRSLVDSPRAGSSGSGGPAAAGEGRSGLDRGRRGEPAGLARAIRRLCQLPRRRGRGPGPPGLPGPDLGALVAIKARSIRPISSGSTRTSTGNPSFWAVRAEGPSARLVSLTAGSAVLRSARRRASRGRDRGLQYGPGRRNPTAPPPQPSSSGCHPYDKLAVRYGATVIPGHR